VTVTFTVFPAVPVGAVAVILLPLFTVKLVAFVLPNFTAVVPLKLVPKTVTVVPPAAAPWLGERPVTSGGGGES